MSIVDSKGIDFCLHLLASSLASSLSTNLVHMIGGASFFGKPRLFFFSLPLAFAPIVFFLTPFSFSDHPFFADFPRPTDFSIKFFYDLSSFNHQISSY